MQTNFVSQESGRSFLPSVSGFQDASSCSKQDARSPFRHSYNKLQAAHFNEGQVILKPNSFSVQLCSTLVTVQFTKHTTVLLLIHLSYDFLSAEKRRTWNTLTLGRFASGVLLVLKIASSLF